MSDIPISSHFFTNRDGNTLMNEFEGILENNPQVKRWYKQSANPDWH